MELVGYARETSTDPDAIIQVNLLKAAGCNILFTEKSETALYEQKVFEECMVYLRKGDMLMVTRVERLVNSLVNLQNLLIRLEEKQVGLKVIEQPIDTSNLNTKASFIDYPGIFAEFEINVRRERQLKAMARAKNNGVCRGRKPFIDSAKVHSLRFDEKLGASEIARKLGIGRSSVYKVLARHPS